jgi:hypothetical protein
MVGSPTAAGINRSWTRGQAFRVPRRDDRQPRKGIAAGVAKNRFYSSKVQLVHAGLSQRDPVAAFVGASLPPDGSSRSRLRCVDATTTSWANPMGIADEAARRRCEDTAWDWSDVPVLPTPTGGQDADPRAQIGSGACRA